MKKFDLNIEKILENWEVKHAVREIIANALDEQKLSNTSDIEIYKQGNEWVIKDYGRGLRYEHFTQNENEEKLNSDGVIGKFGIGLKDALATFERKGVEVRILSKYGDITLGKSQKSGFDDLITLHAYISEPTSPLLVGTEFHLSNLSDFDVEEGKKLFLKFSEEHILERTKYGSVLRKSENQGKIFINGVLVATEENFLFSYNITFLSASIRKAINRERTNVGRTAYAGVVRLMLLECDSEEIGLLLSEDLSRFSSGSNHDELKWIDVQNHAAKILNKYREVVFVTAEEVRQIDLVEEAESGGRTVVIIPETLRAKISEENAKEEDSENRVQTFREFVQQRSENFEFKFVAEEDMSPQELRVFKSKDKIIQAIGGKPANVREILVSETMQRDEESFRPAAGLWQSSEQRIIVLRSLLSDKSAFLGVLLHELAHAISGYTDATRGFESELTRLLGIVSGYLCIVSGRLSFEKVYVSTQKQMLTATTAEKEALVGIVKEKEKEIHEVRKELLIAKQKLVDQTQK